MRKSSKVLIAPLVFLSASCGSGGETTAPEVESAMQAEATADTTANKIASEESEVIEPAFDLLTTWIAVEGSEVVFRSSVVNGAGSAIPKPVGTLDQAPVWSYVWPTSLDSSVVGFESEQGILALAATSHPDFDDTPLYDEDGDGNKTNDGSDWHAHWVVLVESANCGGNLSVRDIPEGQSPQLPATWPELPILIDSPDIPTTVDADRVEIRVPLSDIGPISEFSFDGVTAGLRVSTSPHDPLLCVDDVFDIASGDLSLPGVVGDGQ